MLSIESVRSTKICKVLLLYYLKICVKDVCFINRILSLKYFQSKNIDFISQKYSLSGTEVSYVKLLYSSLSCKY